MKGLDGQQAISLVGQPDIATSLEYKCYSFRGKSLCDFAPKIRIYIK